MNRKIHYFKCSLKRALIRVHPYLLFFSILFHIRSNLLNQVSVKYSFDSLGMSSTQTLCFAPKLRRGWTHVKKIVCQHDEPPTYLYFDISFTLALFSRACLLFFSDCSVIRLYVRVQSLCILKVDYSSLTIRFKSCTKYQIYDQFNEILCLE